MQSVAHTGASRNCTVPASVIRTPPSALIASYPSSKLKPNMSFRVTNTLTLADSPASVQILTDPTTQHSCISPFMVILMLLLLCKAITTGSPSPASSLMMAHAGSSNCSIGVASMLVDVLNNCFTWARRPATNMYTKVHSGNPPNRTTSFFSATKKTSTVSPAINVRVVKHSYTLQGSITKDSHSASLVSPTLAFSLSLNCW